MKLWKLEKISQCSQYALNATLSKWSRDVSTIFCLLIYRYDFNYFSKLLSEAGKNRERLFKHETDVNPSFPNTFQNSKKLFNKNVFQNSDEFKQLGTLHKENRMADYLTNETISYISKKSKPNSNFILMSAKDVPNDPYDPNRETNSLNIDTKERQANLKTLIGERLRNENLRSMIINQELSNLRQTMSPKRVSLFPVTTNQETFNEE